MTKASTAKTVAANKFDVLYNASVNVGKSFDVLRAAFVAAGGDQDEPKRILMAGRVSHALKCTREVALLALSKKGNPGLKTDVPDDVRNIKEQRACGAARTFLSSCLKAWGIKSAEARGGDRSASKGAMDTEKLKPAGKPSCCCSKACLVSVSEDKIGSSMLMRPRSSRAFFTMAKLVVS